MKEKILVLSAHNDDQIIGAGGTLAKYAKEGGSFKTIIFSFGESSHPHLKREIIVQKRVKESIASDKILGGSGIAYFGLKEGSFTGEFKEKNIKKKLEWIIKREKPTKIFTHSIDDPHPDHKAVHYLVMQIIKEDKIQCEVYSFDIWNVLNIRHRLAPKLLVDVSSTFEKKISAISAHKSQQIAIFTLFWNIYVKAWLNGWNYGYRQAEVFYKLN